MTLSTLINLTGVSVSAISGALEARNKRMDVFGAIVVALATALGGGTIRDVLLQHGAVFWIADTAPLLVAISTAIIAFIASSTAASLRKALLIADAGGLALFTVVGTEKAIAAQAPPVVALLMGVVTGVAGGILRDILCNEIPLVLRRDVYATASIAGAALYLLLIRVPNIPPEAASIVSIVTVFVIRLAVLRWKLALPEALQAPTESTSQSQRITLPSSDPPPEGG